ncbi:MAG: FecR domain-containing protein [Opitutaceae bacterium]|nr:FecR domain-containing protein [Opitutaceae bacterium]
MDSTHLNPGREADIELQAAAWLARKDRGLTASEQDEFFQWLAADPRHGEWLARHQQTVRGLKLLAQWRPEHGARPNPDLLTPPRARGPGRWVLPVGFAAAAGIALAVALWQPWKPDVAVAARATPAAPDPQIRRKLLEDGSTIDLNRGAEVEVRFGADERRVRLVRGQAHFSVRKNPARPFIVQAGRVEIRAVGTAFEVKLAAKSVEVLVTEGRVGVATEDGRRRTEDGAAAASSVLSPLSSVTLIDAGERAVVSLVEPGAPPKVSTVAADELARLVAWQYRQLEFTDAPLEQVVAEFNRDNRVKLVVDDPALAALPIGATLRSDNVDGFVRLLETSFHVAVERRSDGVIVLRQVSAPPKPR